MYALLDRVFRMGVKTGTLRVTAPSGQPYTYGDETGEPVSIRITTDAAARRIAMDPDLALGETYMEGSLIIEQGVVYDMIALLIRNADNIAEYPAWSRVLYKLRKGLKWIDQYNPAGKARANIAHHYDLSGQIYDLFLDRDRQYSCAYFETPGASLEEAQSAKKRHLAAKLGIEPGMKVLDIGSGWGGLGLYLAEICGAHVTGITLSEEQHKLSNERAAQRGVDERVQFRLLDYRDLDEKFDRIVSVGMFEHVGVVHYKEFFAKCHALLNDNGVAVLHSINRSDGPGATSAWIKKYIFPGGYVPALSEVVPHLERQGLYITDIEILRLHYAETLRHWRKLFADNRARAREIYDERFCRMWEFYLAASEASFRHAGLNNFQLQFCKNRSALPFTRDYIQDTENALRALESKRPRLKSIPAE